MKDLEKEPAAQPNADAAPSPACQTPKAADEVPAAELPVIPASEDAAHGVANAPEDACPEDACPEDAFTEDAFTEDDAEDQAFFNADNATGINVCLFGFLSPGTQFCIRGEILKGVLLNLGLSAGCVVVPLASVACGLFPVPLAAALVIGYATAWIYGIVRVFLQTPEPMRPLQARGQTGFAFLTFWMPCLFCFLLSTNFILQRTWMGNDSMEPGIQKGDIILVDRHAYWSDDPAYGDVILVEELTRSESGIRKRAFFGRIIAKPGDAVQLHGYHPSVNGKDLEHYVSREDAEDVTEPSKLVYELPFGTEPPADESQVPADWYPVLSPSQLLFSETNTVTLDDGYYFILEDNRISERNRTRSSYGSIVHRSEIRGRPQYIICNTEAAHMFDRYGLAIR
ncbi:MAG: signal peptidase I [Proteobacteria bacterium]|nr:signal peptidase I [Pseudomonadota bacterium]